MLQAITTRFLGPTNHRGARIVARAEAGYITVSWDYALDTPLNHRAAALAFARKWGWSGRWTGGATSEGYVWVRMPRSPGVDDFFKVAP